MPAVILLPDRVARTDALTPRRAGVSTFVFVSFRCFVITFFLVLVFRASDWSEGLPPAPNESESLLRGFEEEGGKQFQEIATSEWDERPAGCSLNSPQAYGQVINLDTVGLCYSCGHGNA